MPIARGEQWGKPGVPPDDTPEVWTDSELAQQIDRGAPIVIVRGGDLARTVGVTERESLTGWLLPVDAASVTLDGQHRYTASAHVLIGNPLTSARHIAIMNAAHVGRHNIAPRAHPGDGSIDVIESRLRPIERVKARRRMVTGTHLPHPEISSARRRDGRIELDRARPVRVDGKRVGRARVIEFSVLPDAILLAV